MRKCCHIALALTVLASGVQGMNERTLLDFNGGGFVSATSTNVTFKRSRGGNLRWITGINIVEDNEGFSIPLDHETEFASRDWSLFYTPVTFKNKQKGFRISGREFNPHTGLSFSDARYVAVDDIPVEMGVEDVDMIMVDGKWEAGDYAELKLWNERLLIENDELKELTNVLLMVKGKLEREIAALKAQDPDKEALSVPVAAPEAGRFADDEAPSTMPESPEAIQPAIAKDEAARSSRHWLYAAIGILLCAGAVLYFTRKGKSAQSA